MGLERPLPRSPYRRRLYALRPRVRRSRRRNMGANVVRQLLRPSVFPARIQQDVGLVHEACHRRSALQVHHGGRRVDLESPESVFRPQRICDCIDARIRHLAVPFNGLVKCPLRNGNDRVLAAIDRQLVRSVVTVPLIRDKIGTVTPDGVRPYGCCGGDAVQVPIADGIIHARLRPRSPRGLVYFAWTSGSSSCHTAPFG